MELPMYIQGYIYIYNIIYMASMPEDVKDFSYSIKCGIYH